MYVGIDPSINSTGVCVSIVNDNLECVHEKFYIIKGSKLTRTENAAELKHIDKIQYIIYDKEEVTEKMDYHEAEKRKTRNFTRIVSAIKDIIRKEESAFSVSSTIICQEGISYGSTLRTKSVFDLAGLNYMIRMKFINDKDIEEYIIAPPTEVKKFATGKGNSKKDLVILMFRTYYDENALSIPKIDDIADAFFMSQLARKLTEDDKDN